MLTLLQRFEYKQGARDRSAAKIDTPVQFPLQLNMLPYTSRGRGHDGKENFELARSCTYDLLSVVVHVGEIDTGHYVSYCRVGDQVSFDTITTVPRGSNPRPSGLLSTITESSWHPSQTCLARRPTFSSILSGR